MHVRWINYGASAVLCLLATIPEALGASHSRIPDSCPDYNEYAQKPHPPFSNGSLALPHMRPSEECRTFKSPAVEVKLLVSTEIDW
jgi:hypothetical protein